MFRNISSWNSHHPSSYDENSVLMVRGPYDIYKQMKNIKNFYSSTSITINIVKIKVMRIKSKRITYPIFMYDNNNLEEMNSWTKV
jgi:hypothetical protein